jgi:AcrR family transcriptional regulator
MASRARGRRPRSGRKNEGSSTRPRWNGVESSTARTALLDATERLMLEEGYAAVSSRRVAAEAGLDAGLVYYYFGGMDDLFIALFRRGADRSLERQAQVLSSAQPLWGLWDMAHHQSSTALTGEFIALANHRKAIRAEIASYSKKFRRKQLQAMTSVLERYGIDAVACPPAFIALLMTSISRQLLVEEAFDNDIGHAQTVAFIERHIRELEGERGSSREQVLRRTSAAGSAGAASRGRSGRRPRSRSPRTSRL